MADHRSNPENEIISVIIPVYNGAQTLPMALRSALSQRCGASLEVIVVDDCSTDGSGALAEEFAAADPRVLVLHNPRSLGAAGSRNRGVAAAGGALIAFLDADDAWGEGKLEKQRSCLKRTGAVLCCTGRELMRPDGTLTGRVIGVRARITYQDLLKTNSINCSSVLARREALLAFPMEHEDSHEDYITWLRILNAFGPAAGIDEPLLKYRLSASGKSGSKLKSARMTFRVYRYMGFGLPKSLWYFVNYAWNGLRKYLASRK